MVGDSDNRAAATRVTAAGSTAFKAAGALVSASSGSPANVFSATPRTMPPIVSSPAAIAPSIDVRRADSSTAVAGATLPSDEIVLSMMSRASDAFACSTSVLAKMLPA